MSEGKMTQLKAKFSSASQRTAASAASAVSAAPPRFAFLLLLAIILGFTAAQAQTFYVSPDAGNDAWPGTSSTGPFLTLTRAQTAVREALRRDPSSSITVYLRGGVHQLTQPLTLTAEDSGTTSAPVIWQPYPGERAVLSGGTRITGWQVQPDGSWRVTLPEVARGEWRFQQLFINGQRRGRPRLPREGNFTVVQDLPSSSSEAGRGFDRFVYRAGDLSSAWHNLQHAEVLTYHIWTMSRLPISSVDEATSTVLLAGTTAGTAHYASFAPGRRFQVENVREALGQKPGEFYLDLPGGELTYVPAEGETPETAEVVAPRLEQLVRLHGKPDEGHAVRNIVFRGLSFQHTNYVTPPTGHAAPQAEIDLGAAIEAELAHGCRFEACEVAHTGAWAFFFGKGSQGNQVLDCDLTDLGAGGVKIGETAASKDPRLQLRDQVVSNTLVARGGRLHPAAVGILIAHAAGNHVIRNTITDMYYTGISVGWSWGYHESPAHSNRIEGNLITRIGQGLLSDMGGIYTLGVSPGTVLERNRIDEVTSYEYGGWGIYFDEGTSGVVARNNIVTRTSKGGFHQHYGRENVVENNIFAFNGAEQLMRTRAEDHLSFRLERNIICSRGGSMLGSNWSGTGFVLDRNLYWNTEGAPNFAGMNLGQWRERGHDRHSVIGNPLFADWDKGDFTLQPGSPAELLGFQPIPQARFGCVRGE